MFKQNVTALIKERGVFQKNVTALIKVRDVFKQNITALIKERDAFKQNVSDLIKERDVFQQYVTDQCDALTKKLLIIFTTCICVLALIFTVVAFKCKAGELI